MILIIVHNNNNLKNLNNFLKRAITFRRIEFDGGNRSEWSGPLRCVFDWIQRRWQGKLKSNNGNIAPVHMVTDPSEVTDGHQSIARHRRRPFPPSMDFFPPPFSRNIPPNRISIKSLSFNSIQFITFKALGRHIHIILLKLIKLLGFNSIKSILWFKSMKSITFKAIN